MLLGAGNCCVLSLVLGQSVKVELGLVCKISKISEVITIFAAWWENIQGEVLRVFCSFCDLVVGVLTYCVIVGDGICCMCVC